LKVSFFMLSNIRTSLREIHNRCFSSISLIVRGNVEISEKPPKEGSKKACSNWHILKFGAILNKD